MGVLAMPVLSTAVLLSASRKVLQELGGSRLT